MENDEDYSRNIQARNTSSPRTQEDFIIQVSEKIEGKEAKELSQESNKTESCI